MITDFLKLSVSKDDAAIALRLLRQFKEGESQAEWLSIPFVAWTKLEQFEEFLDHLVTGAPLKPDTLEYMQLTPEQVEQQFSELNQ